MGGTPNEEGNCCIMTTGRIGVGLVTVIDVVVDDDAGKEAVVLVGYEVAAEAAAEA